MSGFASTTDLADKKISFDELGPGLYGYTAEGDPNSGIVISETKDELILRLAGGITQKHQKKEILSREKIKSSLMPPGLQQAMSEQELIDLVEWLANQKKK